LLSNAIAALTRRATAARNYRRMKKLSAEHREWLIRHALLCDRRRLHSKALARARRNGMVPPRRARIPGATNILAPSDLSLATNYEAVISFFGELVEAIFRPRGLVAVDFTTIERLAPAASLLLAATLDLWQRLKHVKLRARDVDRWKPHVRQMLIDLGLFDLLKTDDPPRASQGGPAGPVRLLKFSTGEGSDGSLARAFAKAMVDVVGPIEAQQFLYVGLTEAMTNVAQHAYPEAGWRDIPRDFKRWWMTGSYDAGQRSMRVILLDMGIGIPETLPRSSKWERIRGLVSASSPSLNDDASMIAAAVEAGRSSTGMPGRGHGLDEIRQFVENSAGGRLRILSGRGEVIFEKGSAGAQKRQLPSPVGGTIIEWEVFR
jgi:hypothetical protein